MDTGRDGGMDGLTIAEAAERLGIATDALRKRIRRKSVTAHKVDGRWHVVLPGADGASGTRADIAPPPVRDASRTPDIDAAVEHAVAAYRELAETLRGDVDFLRRELEARTEELRRRDHIIAALAQLRALNAPAGAPQSHEDARETASPDGAVQGPTPAPAPWWRRVRMWLAGT